MLGAALASLPTYKKQASEATTFLCRDFDIQETTSYPSHHPEAIWKVRDPRVCSSPRQGPSNPAGTTLSTQ